jgi:hypothetical protein
MANWRMSQGYTTSELSYGDLPMLYSSFSENEPAFPVGSSDWLCAGHGTCLKGEPTISNYGSQGKSQAQPDGGEGHTVITTYRFSDN